MDWWISNVKKVTRLSTDHLCNSTGIEPNAPDDTTHDYRNWRDSIPSHSIRICCCGCWWIPFRILKIQLRVFRKAHFVVSFNPVFSSHAQPNLHPLHFPLLTSASLAHGITKIIPCLFHTIMGLLFVKWMKIDFSDIYLINNWRDVLLSLNRTCPL